jgi:UDP-N-acetyl-D-mannosaminuronic acid dehydrogenase
MTPMEAELCKLMTNSWRYIQFATVNQFYMIATQARAELRSHPARLPPQVRPDGARAGAGFAAGPCLVKDTMQLAAFSQNQFVLGHAAMLINEGLPAHVVDLAKRKRRGSVEAHDRNPRHGVSNQTATTRAIR